MIKFIQRSGIIIVITIIAT
jgi:hypothetical protein